MLPPLDPAAALANPRFEALYNDLCKHKLKADGTSLLDVEAQKSRKDFDSDLLQARVDAAKRDVVISALKGVTYASDALPDELHELVIVVAALLEDQINGEDLETVQDSLRELEERLPAITAAISCYIEQCAEILTAVTAHGNPRSDIPPQDVISSWDKALTASRQSIMQAHLEQTIIARQIHDTNRQMIETAVRILEQTIHGSVARSTKAKADYLATVAEGMSKKLEVQHVQLVSQLDSGDNRDALTVRVQELSKHTRQLKAQVRDRQAQLDEWKQRHAGNAAAKEYASILKELKAVQLQIDELHTVVSL